MYKIKNTSNDRTKTLLHRTATKWDPEPFFNGRRLRVGEITIIADEHYQRCKHMIDAWVRGGVVSVEKVGEEKPLPPPPAPVEEKKGAFVLPPEEPKAEEPKQEAIEELPVVPEAEAKSEVKKGPGRPKKNG